MLKLRMGMQNTKFKLRPYQEEAVNKLLWSSTLEGADICVLPTGAGKSLIIAELSHRLNRDILILQPSREILVQNVAKMRNIVEDDTEVCIYSASMGKKDIGKYTFATIQSIYKKPELFAHFSLVLIDECHLVNPKKPSSMYTSFLKEIGSPKVIGLTATPYRQDVIYRRTGRGPYDIVTHTTTKLINRTKGRFWHRLVFNINVADLISMGYLSQLEYHDMSVVEHGQIPLNASASDFSLPAYEDLLDENEEEIREALRFAHRSSKYVLVFCSSIEQAEYLSGLRTESAVVTSKTSKKRRAEIIEGFKSGEIKSVYNVGVLTTGFDFPELDCIVLLRPTRSIALYYQMLGRGVRIADGKDKCKVIDVTGTVKELGAVETIALEKHDKWELVSENGKWHDRILYSFDVSQRGNKK